MTPPPRQASRLSVLEASQLPILLVSQGPVLLASQFPVPVDEALLRAGGQLVAFALVSFGVAAAVALVYRWYTRERIGRGLAALVGLSVVAASLQTVGLFGDLLVGGARGLFEIETVAYNLVALVLAGLAAPAGRLLGDRIATDVFAFAGAKALDAEVSRIVRSVGRVTAVELPEEIEDLDGYDPVSTEKKESLAGKTLLFPRRLTVAELRDRLVTRLKADYGVGHVGVEFAADGTVDYLAVGSRAAGIGPTLAPGATAVAIRADPAVAASSGDLVQVWRTDPAPERVLSGELRTTAGDVATVIVDAADAADLDAGTEYRLVTLPAEPRVDREFASLLRAADETMGVVTVRPGSPLVDTTLGSLDGTVAAVRTAEGSIEAIPSRSRSIAAGDSLYVVARPEVIRRIESEASAGDDQADEPTATDGTSTAGAGLDADPDRETGSGPP